jgi:RDD family protein
VTRFPGLLAAACTAAVLAGPAAAPAAAQIYVEGDSIEWARHTAVRIGQDYVLRSGEYARDVVVAWGAAHIDGNVSGDVHVVFGTLELGPSAVISGSLVVIGGTARFEQGATVRQNLLVVGGGIDSPPDFTPGRDHLVIGSTDILERAKTFVPWLTHGLLMGRPIVPQIPWVWIIVLVVFVTSLLLDLIFFDAVALCARALAARPLSTFLVGLLVLLLTGPVAIILAASVIGIAVVPFLLCAVAIAWTIGKVGVSVWIGGSVTGDRAPESRLRSAIAFAIGFAVICFLYMIPVLGFVVWGLVGVVGLGAATLAFLTAYRRENPLPIKPTPPPAPALDPGPSGGATPPPAPPPDSGVPSYATFTAAPAAGPAAGGGASSLVLFPHASFLDRASGFALDVALVLITNNALDLTHHEGPLVMLLLAYHVIFWTWKGTTIGGIICQLRVTRIDGEPLRFIDSLVRALSGMFSIAVLGLGCLWILRDPERQAWHDKIAGTYVVKVPRHYPVP